MREDDLRELIVRRHRARQRRPSGDTLMGSWTLDLIRPVTTWSPEMYELFGLPPNHDGSPLPRYGIGFDLIAPEFQPCVREALEAARHHGRPFGLNIAVVHPSNTLHRMRLVGAVAYEGRVRTHIHGTMTRGTLRKSA